MPDSKRCGNCRWHFDIHAVLLRGQLPNIELARDSDAKSCLMQPWPDVLVFLTMPEAECNLPYKYQEKTQ